MSNDTSAPGGQRRFTTRYIELSIRLLLIGALFYWTYIIIEPFAAMFVWSVVMAVAFYPSFERLAAFMGGRRGLAAVLMIVAGLLLVLGPATWVAVGVVQPIEELVKSLEAGNLVIPPPLETLKEWPVIGQPIYDFWALASTNLSDALAQISPQLKPVGEYVLGMARNAGAGTLKFLLSIALAGYVLAVAPQLLGALRGVARRIDATHGRRILDLAGATIKAVSRGVMGVSLLQAVIAGLGMSVAGVPGAGLLAVTILVLGIVQIGPMLVVAGVVFWAWTHLSTMPAVALTLCMLSTNYIDSAVKPFLLAHGLSTPMPVIFIGVIGGVIVHGFAGLFVGPVVLAVVWELGRAWISDELDDRMAISASASPFSENGDASVL